jgi:hypothetical protein
MILGLELAGVSLDRSCVSLLKDIDLRLEAGAILALLPIKCGSPTRCDKLLRLLRS